MYKRQVMPYFEETLLEDGYADMYAIMKQLIQCGYNGYLNIDHPFFNPVSYTHLHILNSGALMLQPVPSAKGQKLQQIIANQHIRKHISRCV